ncbi:MAG TPA: glycosyltransferase family 2 protein [Candidatus Acidoferrales bacterium]|jgi:hypothetical protein|nr:glycosyltransferase family 2 protein [Candidatus Acidoferrales bacterium]
MISPVVRKISRPFENLWLSIRKRVQRRFYAFKAKHLLPRKRARLNKKDLKIEVITMMYNEAVFAPLFVRHYAPWIDKLTVFYSESSDGTRDELERAAKECGLKSLAIIPVEFPDGFDDTLKIANINQAVRNSSAKFVVCVDADEFVHPWPFETTDPRAELQKETANVIRCRMFQVYRHVTDTDIDPARPPLFQRRHGASDEFQKFYDKPCIVRPDSGVQFMIGCHIVTTPYPESRTQWGGAHWGKADDFCLGRYLRDRRDRLSKTNRERDYGTHLATETEERLRAELKAHENDPQLF